MKCMGPNTCDFVCNVDQKCLSHRETVIYIYYAEQREKNNAIIRICSLSEYIHDLLAEAEIYSNATSQLMSWWGSSGRLFIRKQKRVALFIFLKFWINFTTIVLKNIRPLRYWWYQKLLGDGDVNILGNILKIYGKTLFSDLILH